MDPGTLDLDSGRPPQRLLLATGAHTIRSHTRTPHTRTQEHKTRTSQRSRICTTGTSHGRRILRGWSAAGHAPLLQVCRVQHTMLQGHAVSRGAPHLFDPRIPLYRTLAAYRGNSSHIRKERLVLN